RIEELLAAGAGLREALGRDSVGDEHPRREAAVDLVLEPRPLVVEHRRVRNPEHAADRRQVGRPVREPVVEVLAACEAKRLDDPRSGRKSLAELARAAVLAYRGVGMAP